MKEIFAQKENSKFPLKLKLAQNFSQGKTRIYVKQSQPKNLWQTGKSFFRQKISLSFFQLKQTLGKCDYVSTKNNGKSINAFIRHIPLETREILCRKVFSSFAIISIHFRQLFYTFSANLSMKLFADLTLWCWSNQLNDREL